MAIHHDVLDALVERGLLDAAGRHAVLAHVEPDDGYVEDSVVALGLLDEARLLKFLADFHQTYFVTASRLRRSTIDREWLAPFGDDYARERCVLPVKLTASSIAVVMPHPGDRALCQELGARAGLAVKALVALPSVIGAALEDVIAGRPARPPIPAAPPRPASPPLEAIVSDEFAAWYDGLDAAQAAEVARAEGVLAREREALEPPLCTSVDGAIVLDTLIDSGEPVGSAAAQLFHGRDLAERQGRGLRCPDGAPYHVQRDMQRVRVLWVDAGDARLRIFYGIDGSGRIVLLLGGDARTERFYEDAIARVEELWYRHLMQADRS